MTNTISVLFASVILYFSHFFYSPINYVGIDLLCVFQQTDYLVLVVVLLPFPKVGFAIAWSHSSGVTYVAGINLPFVLRKI
jgi:hypothetical protein